MVDPGEGPPLFLDQTEAQRAEKIFLDWSSAFSQGQDDCPPPLSQGLNPPLGIWLVEVNERVAKSVISVCEKAYKG